MRSIIKLIIMSFIIITVSACECKHDWVNATCEVPKTCSKCQETEGVPLEHDWSEATCETAKNCLLCKKSEGVPLGHNWNNATCEIPETCSICGETKGVALGHEWINATCQHPKKCTVCNKAEGTVVAHNYVPDSNFAGYVNICTYCNENEPNVWCPNCDWSLFTTGVGINGITCPECGTKVL